jgi:hypothetical protein
MALNYAYIFAEIELETNMCLGVLTTSNPNVDGFTSLGITYVAIEVYDEEYIFKYYNWDNGKFYYDEEYTEEYISPLL